MKPSTYRVLEKLRSKRSKGITGEDFPKMTSYTKRLSELRRMGYEIIDRFEDQCNSGRHKRYWLIKEPE